MEQPTLQDWLWVEAMLVQSMIGLISPNFRQIALCYKNSEWHLRVTLDEISEEGEDEVLEIVDSFGSTIDNIKNRISKCAYVNVVPDIIIENGPLQFFQNENQRIIYRRKEPLELYK